jgi:glycosyltransferase involved in cell wall biosynthesis
MKLFFDARYTRTDYHDGISRYSAELGNALLKLTPVTFLISDEKQKQWFPADASFVTIHDGTSLKEPWTAQILNKYNPDVVYSPMQTIGTMGRKYKSVLTMHDMIYYRHNTPPASLPWYVRAGWWLYHQSYLPQRLVLKGADLLTTVSQTSQHDLEAANMSPKPIIIIPNAPQHFSKYPVQLETPITHIIYMGSFMSYKNVETLVKGMEWLPGRTLHLLSRIKPERQRELEAIIPEGAQVRFHNGVTDDEYEKLLADNAVLVTASLDEGYGIPVAEAMAMGVPVVVSDIPVFHEVGADGALYFDPHSPENFAATVKQLDDTTLRDTLITKGKTHIASFNWDTSAKVLLEAIKSVL